MGLNSRWLALLIAAVLAWALIGCDSGDGGGGTTPPAEDGVEGGEDTKACVPSCEGFDCGPDGCGGECGACEGGFVCDAGFCVDPDPCGTICAGTECGWVDTCDCGGCGGGQVCLDGVCDAPMQCDQKGYEIVRTEARLESNGAGGSSLYFQALAGTAAPFDLIVIEVDTAKGGATAPGDVDAAYTAFQSHGAWVYILKGWQGGSVKGWKGGGYSKLLVPARGRVEISALTATPGDRFTATLHAIQFVEATVDGASGAVTPLPEGETWCLDGIVLDAEPAHPNSECGLTSNGAQLGDVIEDFSLVNCYGQWINLHDRCHKSEALWLVATAGW
jgi:hypothetical protein